MAVAVVAVANDGVRLLYATSKTATQGGQADRHRREDEKRRQLLGRLRSDGDTTERVGGCRSCRCRHHRHTVTMHRHHTPTLTQQRFG